MNIRWWYCCFLLLFDEGMILAFIYIYVYKYVLTKKINEELVNHILTYCGYKYVKVTINVGLYAGKYVYL